MRDKEVETHEVYVDHINELISYDKRIVTGVSTSQYDEEEDISVITIKVKPHDVHER